MYKRHKFQANQIIELKRIRTVCRYFHLLTRTPTTVSTTSWDWLWVMIRVVSIIDAEETIKRIQMRVSKLSYHVRLHRRHHHHLQWKFQTRWKESFIRAGKWLLRPEISNLLRFLTTSMAPCTTASAHCRNKTHVINLFLTYGRIWSLEDFLGHNFRTTFSWGTRTHFSSTKNWQQKLLKKLLLNFYPVLGCSFRRSWNYFPQIFKNEYGMVYPQL